MIDAKRIEVKYGEKTALKELSIRIEDGEFIAVLGSNGAGKSSLLKALTGFLKIDRGKIYVNKFDIKEISAARLATMRAVLEQEIGLDFDYTVLQTIQLGNFSRSRYFGGSDAEKLRIAAILKKLGMQNFEDRRYRSLSGGEKRRVQLARAIFQLGDEKTVASKTLFLDEPSAGLDPAHIHCAIAAAKDLCACGASVFAVLHDPNIAVAYADKCLLLKNGELFAFGNTREILSAKNLEKVYQTKCMEIETDLGKFVFFPRK